MEKFYPFWEKFFPFCVVRWVIFVDMNQADGIRNGVMSVTEKDLGICVSGSLHLIDDPIPLSIRRSLMRHVLRQMAHRRVKAPILVLLTFLPVQESG